MKKSGKIANFNPDSVKPVESAKQINQPILFIHGSNDDKIPIQFNYNNFLATKSKLKRFEIIKNAGHLNVWEIGATDLEKIIKTFLYSF